MAWPITSIFGGRSYRDIAASETLLPIAAVIPSMATSPPIRIPWGAGGYTKGRLDLQWIPANPETGTYDLTVQAVNSYQDINFNGPVPESVFGPIPLTAATGPDSPVYLTIAWDDGMIPGNFRYVDSNQVVHSASLALNPIWAANAAELVFILVNNTDQAITMNNTFAALRA